MNAPLRPLAITQGDPAGIGGEIIALAFRDQPGELAGCFVAYHFYYRFVASLGESGVEQEQAADARPS